jgi:hypothetical protein
METKWHQQITSTTKNQNLNLVAFLYSIIYSLNKKINKQSDTTLGNTNDVNINLITFLNFNSIKNHFKTHAFSYMNRIILDIIFKFNTEYIMWLIYIAFMYQRKSDDYSSILKFWYVNRVLNNTNILFSIAYNILSLIQKICWVVPKGIL